MKLVIVSICHNEESTIAELLDRMPKSIKGVNEIVRVVVDDGSTDKTVEVAKKHGALVFQNGSQKRLAYSFQVAADKVLGMGADLMVNIDGDLQFMPEEIPDLVAPIINGEADFVAADRFTDKVTGKTRRPQNMPPAKYYGNLLGRMVVGKLSKMKFADVTCGFRAYNRAALMNINLNSNYTYTQESFQILALKKMRIKQLPVTIKYYPGRKSRVVISLVQYILSSAVNIVRAFRDNAPLSFFGGLGTLTLVLGAILGSLPVYHLIRYDSITPYKYLGFIALFLVVLGVVLWLFGLLADIFTRVLNNQEKIIYMLKESKYKDSQKESKK